MLPLLEALVESQPLAPALPRAESLRDALLALRPLVQPGSLVLLLSDFASLDTQSSDTAETEAALSIIAARSDCRMLWLTDPLEASGLPAGRFRVGIPGRLWWLDGSQQRRDWASAWNARREAIEAAARRLNLPLTPLSTADAVSEALPPLLREPRWAA